MHIPAQSGQRFRFKLATDSGRKWPPIPIDSGHFFPLSGIDMATLKHESGLSNRAIARACSISKETVREYLSRAAEAGLGWPLGDELTEEAVERLLFPAAAPPEKARHMPDWAEVGRELRKKGVTRLLVWMEHREADQRQVLFPSDDNYFSRSWSS